MSDVDASFWLRAMDTKLESMHSNIVWKLVEAPKGIKAIGYKWVYLRKKGVDGKVRLNYSQKFGFDYKETFLLATILKSIRILLFITTHLNYETNKLDVKKAFLNDYLSKTI